MNEPIISTMEKHFRSMRAPKPQRIRTDKCAQPYQPYKDDVSVMTRQRKRALIRAEMKRG